MKIGYLSIASFLVLLWVDSVPAADADQVAGTLTIDGQSMPLSFAASYEIEDLYDPVRKNTAVLLTDRAMMCLPKAVQGLIDAKADLTYQRAPGLTVLTEAGACPEAEKILRAAGAQ